MLSVQFSRLSCPTICDPHGLQHARLPCPSPIPRACSNSCPLSWWCHPTISSSVIPFSSCLQSFPASVSFQMSQFLTSGSQSTGVSASASVLPMNIQDWFPLGLTGLIFLQWGTLKSLLYTTVQKRFFGFHQFGCINSSAFSLLYSPTLTSIHDYWTTALTRQTFVAIVMSLLTRRGPLEKGMANHFSILALRTPWTVIKGKKMTPKDEPPGW